jgi:predicted lipase
MNNVLIDKQAATLAGRMLCASTLAYSIPNSPPHISPPNANIPQTSPYYNGVGYYSPPSMIQNGLAACTIGQNQDGIILAFRGTVYDSLYDWLDDLLIVTTEGTNLPGRVHSGFYDDLMKIIHVIASSLQTLKAANPGQNLIITGHSKGGRYGSNCCVLSFRQLLH